MEQHGSGATGPFSAPPPFAQGGPRQARGVALAIGLALLLAPAAVGLWSHNRMLERAEAVDAAWAQVESSLQRRADLVPRLVETVKRYLRHEAELLTAVTRERAALGGTPPADPVRLEALARQEAAVSAGVRTLLAAAESYPELRSADQFLELQAQLEGTENRIHVARMAFNDAVRDYNAALVQIPTRFVAGARGLERRPYFRADEGARVAGPLGLE